MADGRHFFEIPREVLASGVMRNVERVALPVFVSKAWMCTFHSPFAAKIRIQMRLGISIELLNQFEMDVSHHIPGMQVDYVFIETQLLLLERMADRLPSFLKYSYRAPRYFLSLLTCCLNNKTYAEKVLPSFGDYPWVTLALFGNLKNIYSLYRRDELKSAPYYFEMALKAGNLSAAQMIHQDNEFPLTKAHLDFAASSGNVALVKWVLEINCQLFHDRATYISATESGEENILKYFAKVMDTQVDMVFLRVLCRTGKLSSIKWFCKQFDFGLSFEELPHVIASGVLSTVQTLMSELPGKYDRRPYLTSAILSGNLALFRFLLEQYETDFMARKEEIKREATKENALAQKELNDFHACIANAGESGNVEILKYCHQALGLPITEAVLEDVVESGDVLSYEYAREHFHDKRFHLGELSSEVLGKCPNPSLQTMLVSARDIQYGFKEIKKPGLEVAIDFTQGESALELFAILTMLLYPAWHDIVPAQDAWKIQAIFTFGEEQLPELQGRMSLIEKRMFKSLLQQLAICPLVKGNYALVERIQKLANLFISAEEFKNAGLVTVSYQPSA